MSPRSFAWRTTARALPSISILTADARARKPCASARLARSASSSGDGGRSSAATSRSPGRSANRDASSAFGDTSTLAAALARMFSRGSSRRAASPKTTARARTGGTADFAPARDNLRKTKAARRCLSNAAHPASGSLTRSSSSRWGRPTKRSYSSSSRRSHGWSPSPRKRGTSSSPRTLHRRSDAGSKSLAPPARLLDLHGLRGDELIDQRALPRPRSEQTPHALHVLALAERPTHDDGHVGIRNIEPLVEHARGHQRAQLSGAEPQEDLLALLAADVAGERHDDVLARDGVCGFVVRGEGERPRVPMSREERPHRLALALGEREQPARLPPGRQGAAPLVGTHRRAHEFRPASLGRQPPKRRMHG